MKILLLLIRCLPILVVQFFSFCLPLSLNPFNFFIVLFFIAPYFFPKLFNLFYRRRLFDFNGLFSHLPEEFLCISLKYFILPVELRILFSNLLILCALNCTFCFILSFAVAISFSFCNLYFLLTFVPSWSLH